MTPIDWSALGLLVIGWLIVSFTAPSPRREVIEWLSACALYAVLAGVVYRGVQWGLEKDLTVVVVGLGFLCALFAAGLLVTFYRALAAMRGGSGSGTSATN